jgi:acyl carrier protein
VNVMLALEDEFEIEFPDSLLNKTTFESIANIAGALVSLGVASSN